MVCISSLPIAVFASIVPVVRFKSVLAVCLSLAHFFPAYEFGAITASYVTRKMLCHNSVDFIGCPRQAYKSFFFLSFP